MMKRPEYSAEIVGQNLKRLRRESGYTVDEIRDYLCLGSMQAVYKYENGRGYPSADVLLALMSLYGVGVEELVEPPVELRDRFCRVEYLCRTIERTSIVFQGSDMDGTMLCGRLRHFINFRCDLGMPRVWADGRLTKKP